MANLGAILQIVVDAQTGTANAKLLQTQQVLEKTARRSETAMARFAKAAKYGAAIGGAGLVVGLVKSTKAAMDFEASFAEVRKTVDATEPQFRRLERGMRGLARQIPINVNELNALAGQAGALGIAQKDLVAFTKTAAELGIATDLSAEDAANALARLSNIMGTSSKDFRRLGSSFVALGNDGASTEREIAAMALRLAATGKQVGLNEAQVLGFSSALASVGIEAEAGGSAFSRAFSIMSEAVATGNANLQGFAEVAGMSSAAFSKLFERDASMAMVEFVEGLGRIKKEGGNALVTLKDLDINEVRLRNSLLSAAGAGKLFRDQLKTGSRAWRENNALTREANARYDTTEAKLDLLKNRINDVAITVGDSLMPTFRKVLDRAGEMATRIGKVWDRTNLTTEQKLSKTLEIVTGGMGDLIALFTEKLGELAPVILKLAAKLGFELSKGLVEGFMKSDLLGKAFTAAVLIRMIGGKGAFMATGRALGLTLGVGIGQGAAAGAGAGLAGGAAAGAAAGGGILASARGALGAIKWGRLGAISIGAVLAEGAISEFQRYMTVKGSDLTASLGEQAKSGWLENMFTKFSPNSGAGDWLKSRFFDEDTEKTAGRLLTIMEQIQTVGGQRLLDLAAEGNKLAENVEKTKEVRDALAAATKPVQGARNAFDLNLSALGSGLITRMKDIRLMFRKNLAEINVGWEQGTRGWRDATAKNMTATIRAIQNGMNRGLIATDKGAAAIAKIRHDRLVVTGRDPFKIAEGFASSWRRTRDITPKQINEILRDLRRMPRGARQSAIDSMLQMAQQLRQKGVLPKSAVKDLQSAIVTRFGVTRRQSLRAVGGMIRGISGGFGNLAGAVKSALGNIGVNVEGILGSLGAASGFSFTVRALRNVTTGIGNLLGLQKGGVVPGHGDGDKVPMALPVGSFILNKKATEAFGFQSGGAAKVGNVLLEPGERVFYPSEVSRMGRRTLEHMNQEVPRFQDGGSFGLASMFDLPKPKIEGPSPLREGGQKAVDRAHAAAKAFIDKHIPKGAAGAGTHRNYPGLSGDTDFSIALGIALSRLARATVGHISVTSGWRSIAEQTALWNANPNPNEVAPPGRSNHGRGTAADISPQVGAYGGKERQFGLHFPMSWEPWHIELMQRGGLFGKSRLQRRMDKRASRVWRVAAPFFGKSAASPVPRTWAGGTGHSRVANFEDGSRAAYLTRRDAGRFVRGGDRGEHALIHEWAHMNQAYKQKKGSTRISWPRWMVEGGAEAFTQWAAPRIFGKLGVRYRDPFGGKNYAGFVARVERELGDRWIRSGQFRQQLQDGGEVAGLSGGRGSLRRWYKRARSRNKAPWLRKIRKFNPDWAYTLAKYAGIPNPKWASQVVYGESTYNPRAVSSDGGYGLWQITPRVGNQHIVARYGGISAMFDPLSNARAARDVYKERLKMGVSGESGWYGNLGPAGSFDRRFWYDIMFPPKQQRKARVDAGRQHHYLERLKDWAGSGKANEGIWKRINLARRLNIRARREARIGNVVGSYALGKKARHHANEARSALKKVRGGGGKGDRPGKGNGKGRGPGDGPAMGVSRPTVDPGPSKKAKERAKQIRKLLTMAAKAKSVVRKRGLWWQAIQSYAKGGDFGKGEFQGVYQSVESAFRKLDPERTGAALYNTLRWLGKNVPIHGRKDNRRLPGLLSKARRKGEKFRKVDVKRLQPYAFKVSGAKGIAKLMEKLGANKREMARLDEFIQVAQDRAVAPWSDPYPRGDGAEETPAEIAEQIRLNEKLLERVRWHVGKLTGGKSGRGFIKAAEMALVGAKNRISTVGFRAPWLVPGLKKGRDSIKQAIAAMKGDLKAMVGLTGTSGKRNDVISRLKELGVSKSGSAVGGSTMSIQDLLSIVEATKYNVFDRMPTFHKGGTVPGAGHEEVMALVKARESVYTPEQNAQIAGALVSPAAGPGDVKVIVHGDIVSDRNDPVEVVVGSRRFKAEVRREIAGANRKRELRALAQ